MLDLIFCVSHDHTSLLCARWAHFVMKARVFRFSFYYKSRLKARIMINQVPPVMPVLCDYKAANSSCCVFLTVYFLIQHT